MLHRLRLLSLALTLAVVPACKEHLACRPGTLFVKLAGLTQVAGVDHLLVTLLLDGATLSTTVDYKGGETLEIELPAGRYVSGASLYVGVRALAGDLERGHGEKTLPALPADCAALDLDVTSSLEMGVAEGDGGLKSNGAACAGAAECESGLCVDGYCCNASCQGTCEACDVPTLEGVCAPVPNGPPHGARTPCSGAGACAGACGGAVRSACVFPGPTTSCRPQSCAGGQKTRAAGCDGQGQCAAVEMLTCPQGCQNDDCMGACASDAPCATATPATPFCDDGVCTAKKPRGRACADLAECTSGKCADGVCCNVDCAAQCDSCKEAGAVGTCVRVTGSPRSGGAPARGDCMGTAVCKGACDGVAADCQLPTSSTPCGATSCASGTLTPTGSCANGGCAQPSTPCPNGNCASATACGACTTDGQCGAGRWCNGGSCQNTKANGSACSIPNECGSGNCETAASGSGSVCCAADCTGSTPLCKPTFDGCMCTASSCGAGLVCNPATLACCNCSSCRSATQCGGACPKNCNSCCDCGATNTQCCPGACP